MVVPIFFLNKIFRLEYELRKIYSDLFVPYWDTTLDQFLPNPADSIMWTDEFMGRSDENGTVISGPAAHWTTLNVILICRKKKFFIFFRVIILLDVKIG